MLVSSIVTVKLLSILTKGMINLGPTKRIASNLILLSKSYLFDEVGALRTPGCKRNHDVQDENSTEYLVQNWLESLFARFQMIVLWHDKTLSFIVLTTFLASFR